MMFEEDEDLMDIPLAEQLKHLLKLYHAIENEWVSTSTKQGAYPKAYTKQKIKTLMHIVKKGVKIIRKKNPLFVEMPTLKEAGNGQVKKVYDNKEAQSDEEIEVRLPANQDIERIDYDN